jgi:hypothetical protein
LEPTFADISRPPRRRLALSIAAAGLLAMTAATSQAGTGVPDSQLWTEMDVAVPVTERVTVTGIGQLRLSETLPNPSQTAGGLDLSYREGEWSYTAGYRHQLTGDRINEDPNVTQEARGSVTYAHRFGRNTVAVRLMFVDTITASSNPWRARLRVEYRRATEGPGPVSFWYVNDEVFYQFSDGEFFRNRAQAGANLQLHRDVSLRVYYQRQDTRNATPGAINALGLTLGYTFD